MLGWPTQGFGEGLSHCPQSCTLRSSGGDACIVGNMLLIAVTGVSLSVQHRLNLCLTRATRGVPAASPFVFSNASLFVSIFLHVRSWRGCYEWLPRGFMSKFALCWTNRGKCHHSNRSVSTWSSTLSLPSPQETAKTKGTLSACAASSE